MEVEMNFKASICIMPSLYELCLAKYLITLVEIWVYISLMFDVRVWSSCHLKFFGTDKHDLVKYNTF